MLNQKSIIEGWLWTDSLKNIVLTVDYKDSLLIIENKKGLAKRLAEGTKIPAEWSSINYFEVIIDEIIENE